MVANLNTLKAIAMHNVHKKYTADNRFVNLF